MAEANGDSRASAERPDYSSFAQQKRSSVELGMGVLSHAAHIHPGAFAELLQDLHRRLCDVACPWDACHVTRMSTLHHARKTQTFNDSALLKLVLRARERG